MYLCVILPISILDLGSDGLYEGKKRQASGLLRHFRGARLANGIELICQGSDQTTSNQHASLVRCSGLLCAIKSQ